jgi:DNA repair protein RecO (recombination protein O)
MQRSYKASGFVVRRTKIGEADLIIQVISDDFGLIPLKVRGARKIKSKLSGYLQTISQVRLEIAKGKGTIDTICGVETINTFAKLKKNLTKVAFAFYLFETYLALIGETADKKAYEALAETFNFLNHIEKFHKFDKIIYLWFSVQLLETSGQMIELEKCSGCGKKFNEKAQLSPKYGGIICEECKKNATIWLDATPNVIKLLRVLENIPIGEISKIKIKQADLEKAYLSMLAYCEYFFEKRLNSANFFNHIRNKNDQQ